MHCIALKENVKLFRVRLIRRKSCNHVTVMLILCFNKTVRKTRDNLYRMGSSEVCLVRAKLMCAVRGLQAITVHNIKDSFTKTGLWPMQFNFAN